MVNPLQQAKDALGKAIEEKKRGQELIKSLGPAVVDTLKPVLDELVANSKLSKEELLSAIAQIQINVPKTDVPKAQVDVTIPEIKVPAPQVTVNVPEIKSPVIPEIKLPKIVVPKPEVTVNIPEIKIPKLQWPSDNMPIEGWVKLQGVDLGNPLPVQLRDANGRPVNLFENLTQIVGGGGGISSRIVKISGFADSAFSGVQNADGRLRVSVETGGSGLTDSELRASSVPVEQVSGSIWSVSVAGSVGTLAANIVDSSGVAYSGSNPLPTTGSATLSAATGEGDGSVALRTIQAGDTISSVSVTDIFGSASASVVNPDGRLKVELPTGSSGLTDTELRASALSVIQLTGSVNSVNLLQTAGNATVVGSGYQDNALRVVHATDAVVSVYANNPIAQGDAATALRVVIAGNSDVSVTATQTGTWNIATVTTVTGITNTVAAANVDSTGVQYSGSNPMPVTGAVTVNGSLNSVLATGTTLHDVADDGDAPLKIGGIAMTANPTAVTAGDRASFRADTYGRQVVVPYQVRDLVTTAYVTLSSGTETTLKAGASGVKLDLVYIGCSTDSTVTAGTNPGAITVNIREVKTGGTVATVNVPYDSIAGFAPPVPMPQSEADASWTVQLNDITGTNVYVSALFVKN